MVRYRSLISQVIHVQSILLAAHAFSSPGSSCDKVAKEGGQASSGLSLLSLHAAFTKEAQHIDDALPSHIEKDGLQFNVRTTPVHDRKDAEIGLVLLGMVGFIMGLFYMVNSHMNIIVTSTWSMITMAVSIFIAVMTQGIVSTIVAKATGQKEPERDVPPSVEDIGVSASLLIIWWLLVVFQLFLVRGSLLRLKGYGTIGGHLLGFASIRLCGQVATSQWFRDWHWKTLIVIVLYAVVVAILMKITHVLYLAVRKLHEHGSRQLEMAKWDEHWHEQYKDTGIDFFCMGTASMLCLFIRFVIVGPRTGEVVPSVEEVSRLHPSYEVQVLGIVGLCLFLVVGVLVKVHHSTAEGNFGWIVDVATTTTSLTAAFCLLRCADWHFYGWLRASLTEHVVVALLFSAVAILFICFISVVLHHGGAEKRLLRGVFTGVSLLVGLSWEKTFTASLESLEGLGTSQKVGGFTGGEAIVCIASITLLLVVFPAWMVYMLPKGDCKLIAHHSSKRGGLPCWAMCCDCIFNPFNED